MSETPRWRATFDAVEREVAPRLQAALRSEQFGVAIGIATQLRRGMQQRASRTSRRVLHQLNLPAGSDVSRILAEVGKLRQQVRQLQRELDDTRSELVDRDRQTLPRTSRRAATTSRRSASGGATGTHSKGGGARGAAARSQRSRRTDQA